MKKMPEAVTAKNYGPFPTMGKAVSDRIYANSLSYKVKDRTFANQEESIYNR